MSSAEDLNRKAEEVGQRIRALMSRRGMDHNALGEALGITANAVTKIVARASNVQSAKLCRLADALGADANEILGYQPGTAQGVFGGVLEGTAGCSQEEARKIAAIELVVLDDQSTGGNPEDRRRHVAEYSVRQFVDSKTRGRPKVSLRPGANNGACSVCPGAGLDVLGRR